MTTEPQAPFIAIVALAIIIAVIGCLILTAPDTRNGVQKLGDAIEQLPNGADKAARELKNRTPGEKFSDAAKDKGDDIKKATNQQ